MKLLFKQRIFSWFDNYDVYDEQGNTKFTVMGEAAWGHFLRIYDADGNEVGYLKEKLFSFLPKFEMYIGDKCVGCIRKKFSLFRPQFTVDFNGWQIDGNVFELDYAIRNIFGFCVAIVTKELWHFSDTYIIDVADPDDALCALMLVLAIDAEKCSRSDFR